MIVLQYSTHQFLLLLLFFSFVSFFAVSTFALVAAILVSAATAASDSHLYQVGDEVEMLVNTVGPYSNPSETYQYYSLPFCQPMHVEQRANTLGEVLEGSMKYTSMYEIRFGGTFVSPKKKKKKKKKKDFLPVVDTAAP
jgi:hypothetical protein